MLPAFQFAFLFKVNSFAHMIDADLPASAHAFNWGRFLWLMTWVLKFHLGITGSFPGGMLKISKAAPNGPYGKVDEDRRRGNPSR